MYRKTVLRRLIKRLPLSTDVDFQDENEYDVNEPTSQEIQTEPVKKINLKN